jgi:cysteine-rich repeat protein
VAESCTGSAAACPADAKSTAQCRASAGSCDVAESCDGVGDDCPADAFVPASVECRAAAGVCDAAESCTGTGAACPADAKSTAQCRASAGSCDVAESCDGVGDACPADAFAPASVECRPSTGSCDVAESCTGSDVACPSDGFQPDETPCDDANACSIDDRCISGVCGGFLLNCGNGTLEAGCFEQCDDGNNESGDGCHENCQLEPCGPEPIAGCRPAIVAGKAGILVLSRLNPDKNKLQWKYSPGDTTPKADFGDPLSTTSFDFCIFDEVAGDPRLAARYAIPAGGMCGTSPCWRESSSGFKYTDKAHASTGISSLVLKQGLTAGKTKILLAGKGGNLPLPVLPFVQGTNVVMQLRGSHGVCWETRFAAPASRNQPDQFRDK